MERKEVVDLFKFLKNIYPNFEVDSGKADTWHRLMKDMDFERVMVKAEQHVQANKFPPTVAEIAAYAPAKNEHLEKMKRWEEEAAKVSPEKRARVSAEIQELIRSKIK